MSNAEHIPAEPVAHCQDCCCARSWKALGITEYTGKSIPEHIEQLRAALVGAVATIQVWHNMGMKPNQASKMWDIYWRNAPEMKPIREALAPKPMMSAETSKCLPSNSCDRNIRMVDPLR